MGRGAIAPSQKPGYHADPDRDPDRLRIFAWDYGHSSLRVIDDREF
jgi:hypothetical protein